VWNTTGRKPVLADSALSVPRVRLGPVPSRRTLLGAGWWPRSAGPVADLPGLTRAILTSPAQPTETELELSV
jgi:hypothetical protein